ncbi:purine nucleoside phosphorylase [Neobacillus niacini]|nr:purine nucleoside phosphorylase [Neobacillus niacini]
MSTVPEAIVAIHGGMKVLGISCLTNMACGILDQPLSHDEVIEVAPMVREKFIKLVKETIARM